MALLQASPKSQTQSGDIHGSLAVSLTAVCCQQGLLESSEEIMPSLLQLKHAYSQACRLEAEVRELEARIGHCV